MTALPYGRGDRIRAIGICSIICHLFASSRHATGHGARLAGRTSHVGNWGCGKVAESSRPLASATAGQMPYIPYDWATTASPAGPLKHHDQVCFSAGKISWCVQSGESFRLFLCAEGGPMVWRRAAVAIEHSLVPIISNVAARSRLRMRRSIAPLPLPCLSPARPLGFG